jgi:predicted DNA binding CopG/RHH family protein
MLFIAIVHFIVSKKDIYDHKSIRSWNRMFNKTTKAITIRVPEELAKRIDSEMAETGFYSNRQSYVECAIREQITHMDRLTDDVLYKEKEEGPVGKYFLIQAIQKIYKNGTEKEYEKYEGKPESIIIRLPEGLINTILFMGLDYFGEPNVQNFARNAIIAKIEMGSPSREIYRSFYELKNAANSELKKKRDRMDDEIAEPLKAKVDGYFDGIRPRK